MTELEEHVGKLVCWKFEPGSFVHLFGTLIQVTDSYAMVRRGRDFHALKHEQIRRVL